MLFWNALARGALFLAAGAAVATVLSFGAPGARADAFFFGYGQGGHGHRHHHHRHYHHGYRAGSSLVIVSRPPVYYAPPPRVVYVPPPRPVYIPAPAYTPPVTLVPASPVYQTADGQYCREYQSVVTVGGMARDSYGTACYAPDGTWRIVR